MVGVAPWNSRRAKRTGKQDWQAGPRPIDKEEKELVEPGQRMLGPRSEL